MRGGRTSRPRSGFDRQIHRDEHQEEGNHRAEEIPRKCCTAADPATAPARGRRCRAPIPAREQSVAGVPHRGQRRAAGGLKLLVPSASAGGIPVASSTGTVINPPPPAMASTYPATSPVANRAGKPPGIHVGPACQGCLEMTNPHRTGPPRGISFCNVPVRTPKGSVRLFLV